MIIYQTFLEWETIAHGEKGLKPGDIIVSYGNNEFVCEKVIFWDSYGSHSLYIITDEVIKWMDRTCIKYPFNQYDELAFRLAFV